MTEKVSIEKKVLSENDRIAGQIRQDLSERNILCLNVVSSPGSGKTSLLERTLESLGNELEIALVAGDVQTDNDASRLMKAGGKLVRPIVTGGACHLDAMMVAKALDQLDLNSTDLLIIENVGNLVCPSSYDLGEDMKVVLISTTEGDDKPLKYPAMFRRSSVMVINKTDLIGTSEFDLDRVKANALQINGNLTIMETSCRTGDGLEKWVDWLKDEVSAKKQVE
ncbi:MAG: hydrogenase nickel incorporation protein HypB [Candidatus Zixiibacteriota bacterium]|nr:MAG: hydrogenase nickel incorporation protein HypB [candidate division Zixibacteria bacterium]